MVISSLALYLALSAGVVTSLTIIWTRAVKPVIRAIKRVHEVTDEVMGYGPRLDTIEKNSRQLTNNGGSHMKDAVDRIERSLGDHLAQSAQRSAENKAEFLNIYKTLATGSAAPIVQVGVDATTSKE